MGFLERVFSRSREISRNMAAESVQASAAEDHGMLIELEIKGESFAQDALAAIAGPKDL